MSEPEGGAAPATSTSRQPRNMHGFISFGVSATALMLGTALVGIVSVALRPGLPPWLSRAIAIVSYAVPLLFAAVGLEEGIKAFRLAKRGIPCHKESEFAAFLGIVIALLVAGLFLWFGLVSRPQPL